MEIVEFKVGMESMMGKEFTIGMRFTMGMEITMWRGSNFEFRVFQVNEGLLCLS